jgi:Calcineurin-like phosphoesterase
MTTAATPHPLHGGRATHKPRREYGDPVNTAKAQVRFIPPPALTKRALTLPLDVVVPDLVKQIVSAKKIVFHSVGDTGPAYGPDAIRAVSDAMEAQVKNAAAGSAPSFFYHLGDVVYFNGQSTAYQDQFYDPYKFYPRDIFAIAGNHDGDTQVRKGDPVDSEPTLYGFMQNFCAVQAERVFPYRDTMTQPYVYWTLDAPFVTIVGLYSNVEGTLDGRGTIEQQRWFESALLAADPSKCLLVAVHHPPYSLDSDHGGYPAIGAAIDQAIARVKAANAGGAVRGRVPDAILSGHVHDYQRFTRAVDGREIPYVVCGDGGYADTVNLIHHLQREAPATPVPTPLSLDQKASGVTLESYDERDAGFLRITIDADTLTIEYFAVPFGPRPEGGTDAKQRGAAAGVYDPSAVPLHDIVTVDLKSHQITTNGRDHAAKQAKEKHSKG